LECDIKILVSSATKIGVDFALINIGKSFIKTRKSKGPGMKPWGIPCITLAQNHSKSQDLYSSQERLPDTAVDETLFQRPHGSKNQIIK
jgi:hypothetical protein